MAEPEHIKFILKRVFEQLKNNLENDKEIEIEKSKTDNPAIAE